MSDGTKPSDKAPEGGKTLLRAPLSALKGRLIGVGILDALAGVTLVGLSWLLAHVLDGLVFRQTEPDAATLGLVAGLLFVRFVLLGLGARLSADIGIQAGLWLRRALVSGLMTEGRSSRLPASGSAGLLLVEGVEAVEPYFARYLPAMVQALFLPVAILVIAVPLDLVTAITLGVTAPLIPVFMILIGKGVASLNAQQWAAMNRLSAYFLDAVKAVSLLRLFGALESEMRILAQTSETWRLGAFHVLRVAFLSSLALEFFATLGVALVAVFIGFRLLSGDMAFERGLFLLVLAPEFYRPLRLLGTQYHARMEATAAADRLMPLVRLPQTVGERSDPPPTPPCCPAASRVVLAGVSFAYGGEAPLLNNLDLTLEPGTLTALVGSSGAGKTTILDLVRGRLTPDAGRVLIDGAPPDLAQRRPVWIPQAPHPFAGTLRSALTLGRPDATDDQILAALKQANADAFVLGRPGGLDGVIGDGGRGLSGGEVRRLALARAFLTDAGLVLLDEPSASLDQTSETALNDALKRLTPGHTVLVAAHRLATIRAADRIVVLENGRIVEDGSFDQLQGQGGAFVRLLGAASPLVAAVLKREEAS